MYYVHILCSLTKKKSWYPALCTGETQSSFAWEMHQSLRENILGPQKRKKRGAVRTRGYPPTFPSYPQWMQQHKSLWHLRKLIFAQGQLQTLPCDAEADGSWLSSPAEEEDVVLVHNVMFWRTGGQEVWRGEKKGESGVVCGLAIQGVDVGHRSRLWGQTVETGCKASRLMYEHCWPFPEG